MRITWRSIAPAFLAVSTLAFAQPAEKQDSQEHPIHSQSPNINRPKDIHSGIAEPGTLKVVVSGGAGEAAARQVGRAAEAIATPTPIVDHPKPTPTPAGGGMNPAGMVKATVVPGGPPTRPTPPDYPEAKQDLHGKIKPTIGRPTPPPTFPDYPEAKQEMPGRPQTSNEPSRRDTSAHEDHKRSAEAGDSARLQERDIRGVIACWDPGDEPMAKQLAGQLSSALDALANGAKLTKADAARSATGDREASAASWIGKHLRAKPSESSRRVLVLSAIPASGSSGGGNPAAKQPCEANCTQYGDFCYCLLPLDPTPLPDMPESDPGTPCIPDHLMPKASATGRTASPRPTSAPPDWVVVVVNAEKLSQGELKKVVADALHSAAANRSAERVVIKLPIVPSRPGANPASQPSQNKGQERHQPFGGARHNYPKSQ
ncbi:MAG: hypothetical protein ACP5UB_04135 [Candidatus Sumerlaeaceae bacterium]